MGNETNPDLIWEDYKRLRSLRKVGEIHNLSHTAVGTLLQQHYSNEYQSLSSTRRKKKCSICNHYPAEKNRKVCLSCKNERLVTGTIVNRQGILHLKFHRQVKKKHPYMRADNSLNARRFAVELMHWVYSEECQKRCFKKMKALRNDLYGVFLHSGMVLKPEYCVTKYFEIVHKSEMLKRELFRTHGKKQEIELYRPRRRELIVPLLWIMAFFELPRINTVLPLLRYFPTNISMTPLADKRKYSAQNINGTSNPYKVYGTFALTNDDIRIYFYWKPVWRTFAFKRKNQHRRIKRFLQTAICHELTHRAGKMKEEPHKKIDQKMVSKQVTVLVKHLRKALKNGLGVERC